MFKLLHILAIPLGRLIKILHCSREQITIFQLPQEYRNITVREAATITGFPNDYVFVGTHT